MIWICYPWNLSSRSTSSHQKKQDNKQNFPERWHNLPHQSQVPFGAWLLYLQFYKLMIQIIYRELFILHLLGDKVMSNIFSHYSCPCCRKVLGHCSYCNGLLDINNQETVQTDNHQFCTESHFLAWKKLMRVSNWLQLIIFGPIILAGIVLAIKFFFFY